MTVTPAIAHRRSRGETGLGVQQRGLQCMREAGAAKVRFPQAGGTVPAHGTLATTWTGACPHAAIREDASINLGAVDEMVRRFPDLDAIFIESGGGLT